MDRKGKSDINSQKFYLVVESKTLKPSVLEGNFSQPPQLWWERLINNDVCVYERERLRKREIGGGERDRL